MTSVQAFSDASCNPKGCAWGGVLLGPDAALVTCAGLLHMSQDDQVLTHRVELRGAVNVIRRAHSEWPGVRVDLYLDNQQVAETLRLAFECDRVLRDPWAENHLEPLRGAVKVRPRWLSRNAPEIALCDALSRQVIAEHVAHVAQYARTGARQSVLIRLGRVLQDNAGIGRNAYVQHVVHLLHRTQRRGLNWRNMRQVLQAS